MTAGARAFLAVAVLVVGVGVGLAPPTLGAGEDAGSHPLAGFERLTGGRWYFDETYQVFEWGVGKRALRATAHFPSPAGPKLVSEGFWYFHPASGEIRGTFVSIEMGLDLFEYVTSFEGDSMTSQLTVHGPKGVEQYVETFEFRGDDHYDWTLWRDTAAGREKVMGGRYERRPAPAAKKETR